MIPRLAAVLLLLSPPSRHLMNGQWGETGGFGDRPVD